MGRGRVLSLICDTVLNFSMRFHVLWLVPGCHIDITLALLQRLELIQSCSTLVSCPLLLVASPAI